MGTPSRSAKRHSTASWYGSATEKRPPRSKRPSSAPFDCAQRRLVAKRPSVAPNAYPPSPPGLPPRTVATMRPLIAHWLRQALSPPGPARAAAGAPHHRDDDVPRHGHAVLAGAGGGGRVGSVG